MTNISVAENAIQLIIDGDTAWLEMNNPPVNGLSNRLRTELLSAFIEAVENPEIAFIVISGAPNTKGFCGGADIREFNTPDHTAGPPTAEIIRTIESSNKPVIAAIKGFALGGGLELALACDYRVADSESKIGLPEANIGLIPGAGGTQRLPRIVGVENALEMVQTGKPINGVKATDIGLVDFKFDGDLREGVGKFIEHMGSTQLVKRRLDPKPLRNPDIAFDERRSKVRRNARNGRAQLAAISSVEDAVMMKLEDGLRSERERFEELLESPESAALKYTFFAEREAAKIPDIADEGRPEMIKSVAVIGAGTMGGGIATTFADSGFEVTLMDVTDDQATAGLRRIAENYSISKSRGRLSEAEAEERLGRIRTSSAYRGIESADLVVEAVFEDMELKKSVFRDLDVRARADAILATNTSRLNVDDLASVTNRPASVIGMHFFSPANVMRLLEVVRGKYTDPGTVATVMKLGRRLNKVPVLARVSDGFIGNRMLSPFRREADFLVEEGATVKQVDNALTDFGMAMGPFAVADLAGLDISWAARKREYPHRDPNMRYPKLGDKLCEDGRFGQKSGEGYYRYESGSRTPTPDPKVEDIADRIAREELGIERRSISDGEIVNRCLLALVNEGFKLLGEGVALRESDIDVVYTNGYGFPAFRGGPMYWARNVMGIEEVLNKLREFRAEYGSHWDISSTLIDAVDNPRG